MKHRVIGLIAAVGVLLMIASVAVAVGNGSERFTACLTPDGRLTKVALGDSPARPCRGRSVQVSWNTRGIEGPQGPIGLPGVDGIDGEQGPAGADGQSCSVVADEEGTITMTCPNGDSVSWTGGTTSPTSGPEVCDGIDNDNNGLIDDELSYCFNGTPAENTDGASCDDEYYDTDGDPANGCEATDDGTLSTFYRDADGDGYGLTGDSITSATQPPGYVPLDGDCDDTDMNVYPGAPEVDDGMDNDCDGFVDNA